MGVHPDEGASWRDEIGQPAGAWRETARWILGIDPAFDGGPVARQGVLRQRQRLARGDAQLLADHIHAGHHLGDRTLDLNPSPDSSRS